MMKKKILSLCLAAVVAALAVFGASLAYFTDTDRTDNVFTVGNVDISLKENFGQNAKLLPTTGKKPDGSGLNENGVVKEVDITNAGSEDAWVRVHIAIPQILDDGAESFDASNNVLHFNYTEESLNWWSWKKTDSGLWNYYETQIDGVTYNVYVVTYKNILASGETTADHAMHQVYLDKSVTNTDVSAISELLGENWEIKVVAEGVQAGGFDNAYTALDTAFGAVGTYNPFQ